MRLLSRARDPRVLGAAALCAAVSLGGLPAAGVAQAAMPAAHGGGGGGGSGGGAGGGEEGVGNKLSYPVIWADDTLALPGVMGDVAINPATVTSGYLSPDDTTTACLAAPQNDATNLWQAENLAEPGNQVTQVDWGDNLEAKDWTAGPMVRVETALFDDSLAAPMNKYEMCWISGSGTTELWGMQVTENESPGPDDTYTPVTASSTTAMVYTSGARMTIQRIAPGSSLTWNREQHRWVGDGASDPIVNAAAWEAVEDGTGGYGAELNIQGKIVYGYNWRTSNLPPGEYRLTFSLDDAGDAYPGSGTTLENASILASTEGEESSELVTPQAEPTGNTPMIDPESNLSYIDVGLSGSGTEVAPLLTATAAPSGKVGVAYSYTFSAIGDPTPTYSASSGIPSGLSINPSTGELSGTPTAAGTYTFTVTASNGVTPADISEPITVEIAPADSGGGGGGGTVPPPGGGTVPPPGGGTPGESTPGAPSNVVAVGANASASVAWVPPVPNGGPEVNRYRVQATPGGAGCEVDAPAVSCTVPGLENGQTYRFRVQAQNSVGWGPFSPESNEVTPGGSTTPTITITGTRDRERVRASGIAAGLPPGSPLTPVLDLGNGPAYGRQVAIGPDGAFTWQRRIQEQRTLQLSFGYGDDTAGNFQVVSNTLDLSQQSVVAILITGERDRDRDRKRDRIRIVGSTQGVPAQTQLRTMINLGNGPQEGLRTPRVGSDGLFAWERRIQASKTLRVQFAWGDTYSNELKL